MKKRNLKSLKLSKNTISAFETLKGGNGLDGSGGLGCLPPPNPPLTKPFAGCDDTINNYCDSRLTGCYSYFCPQIGDV
jgi:hypothetical protein